MDAIDLNENVLKSIQGTFTTKLVSGITCNKNDDNKSFTVNITGLDARIAKANTVKFDKAHMDNKKYSNIKINSDRSVQATMYASDVENTFLNTVYYLHFQFWDTNGKFLDTICVNVRFNETYVEQDDDEIDVNFLKDSGEYDITVTDLAGNQTFKSIKINNN